jgi:NAD(P)-dependent dehydrogenase (short-subunit alcohol dehydrogenase family)
LRKIPFGTISQSQKTAVVTGANKGIGREVVRQLASRGFKVFLGARDENRGLKAVEEIRAEGLTDVHYLSLDVANDESVKLAAESVANQVNALDVLVNNAGVSISGFKGPWDESISDIEATYNVNVYGVIRTIRAFADLLKKSKSGRIVNVGSSLGSLKLTSDPTWPAYHYNTIAYLSSKSALNAVTIAFAKALAEYNIKVNTTCPGYTATDLNGHPPEAHSVEVGAQSTVFYSTIPDDGPTGTFHDKDGVIPW